MTTPTTPGTPTQVRLAALALVKGTSLHADDRDPAAMIISNPARPDRGLIGITYDGYVSWLHVQHFGYLAGIHTSPSHHTTKTPPVPTAMIIHLLTATPTFPPLHP